MGWRGRRVLVTGVRGLIGRAVAAALADAGAAVVGLHRATDRDPPSDAARELAVDLRRPAPVAERIGKVDAVVHLAARAGGVTFQTGHHEAVFADNTAITLAALDLAEACGARRFLLASSAVVYRPADVPLAEGAPLLAPGHDDVGGYAWSKMTDEVVGHWFGQRTGTEVVAVRCSNVYGPEGAGTVVHDLVDRALAVNAHGGELTVWGDGTAVRDFCHVEDAAAAVLLVLDAAADGSVTNVGGGEPTTIGELAETIRSVVAPTARLVFDPTKPQGVAHRVVDVSRLRSLGWRPRVPLPDGVSRTAHARKLSAEGTRAGGSRDRQTPRPST